jgi:O-antigen/teichoic acid export membrane protein
MILNDQKASTSPMTTTPKQFGNAMVLYAIGTLLQRMGSLILIPLYTSALLASEYGALETLTVTWTTFTILINFGLSNALIRFYSECQDDNDVFEMVRTSWMLVTILSFGLYFLLMPTYDSLGLYLFKDQTYGSYISLTFLWAIGGALNQQYFAFYRARQDARTYVIISILYFLFSTALNILLVRFMHMKLLGVLLGNLVIVWGINLIAIVKFFRQGHSMSVGWAKKLMSFGFPLVFGMFGWFILNSADRYFLAYYRDLTEVGMYGLGYKTGLITQMIVIMPFQLAWAPYMFSLASSIKDHASIEYARIMTYLLAVLGFMSLGIYLFSNLIINILGSGKFAEAAEVIPYVLVAYLFNGVYYWAASFLHLAKKTALNSIIVTAMAILNLLLNWAWIPAWGWKGAAWSTVVTVVGTGVLTFIAGEWVYPVKLQTGRLVKFSLVVAGAALIHIFVAPSSNLLGLLLSAVLLLVIPIVLLIVGFFEPDELRFMAALPELLRSKIKLA